MKEINCKKVREEMLTEAKEKLKNIHRKLKLVVIQVEGDQASGIYIRNKLRTCEAVGVDCEIVELPTDIPIFKLADILSDCNKNDKADGIILQLPLPRHLEKYQSDLINMIDWRKDVDGLTDINVSKLWTGKDGIRPATAEAVMRLLPDDLSGKSATIFGRSDLVGKPLIKLLMDQNATVSVCHSKSDIYTKYSLIDHSDIVISAIGKPKELVLTPYSFFNKSTFIDVGINRDENGKICGDFLIGPNSGDKCEYTPVPGGVGILTTAQLVLNLIKCYELRHI